MCGLSTKYGRIPNNINLKEILEGVEGNKTKIRYLKDGIIYMLSLLTIDNYNYYKVRKEGYISLSEKSLSNIIGSKRPSKIVKILKKKGVIEYLPHLKGKKSRRYRLTEKYNVGEFQNVEYSERIKNKLEQRRGYNGYDEIICSSSGSNPIQRERKYHYLYEQFDRNNLDVDIDKGNDFIKNLGNEILKEIHNYGRYREYNLTSLYNYFGRMVSLMEDIKEKNYVLSLSPSNHRFNTNLTSLNRILRPFLKINGQDIGEVDISTSQPYILSTILNSEFSFSTSYGYNLHSIYNELFQFHFNSRNLTPSKQKGNNKYVLGVYMNDQDYNDLLKYTSVDFRQDFYNSILKEKNRIDSDFFKKRKSYMSERDYVKKNILKLLFEGDEVVREHNEVIKLICTIYPGICNFIERYNTSFGNRDFSLLLQRTESYLMLGNVCKKLYIENPDVNFFTIHDSILTTKSDLESVKNTMSSTIYNITQKPVTVKTKLYDQTSVVTDQLVNETWDKIRISSKKKYNKNRSSLLLSNINKGRDLLQHN